MTSSVITDAKSVDSNLDDFAGYVGDFAAYVGLEFCLNIILNTLRDVQER